VSDDYARGVANARLVSFGISKYNPFFTNSRWFSAMVQEGIMATHLLERRGEFRIWPEIEFGNQFVLKNITVSILDDLADPA
jgi:hypothetical protein